MAEETRVTFTGNLTRDPELRFLEGGDAVCRFAIASTPRFMDRTTNEWRDGEPFFLECTAWRQLAERIAESLDGGFKRGARVIATGVLKQRSYEVKDTGEKRTVVELTVEEIGASLRYATVAITKVKSGGGGGHAQRAAEGDDAWVGAAKARPSGNGQEARKEAAPAAAAGGGAFDDL
jgi:single-strand DNA-binding protein